ncbi:MAG: ImmA/IrrE family metallo-endopeptidase [Lachnospiraceae bacterium]|nr:ImmA/IrrE family metallo-endopeptidase [Lachnospiraceae bacterium]
MAGREDNRIDAITAKLQSETKELFESDRYRDYLSCMGRFHNYSVNNTILINAQRPDASLVAGYQAWQQKFDRHVVAGAKGIQIIQPAPWKKKEEVEIKDANGNTVMRDGKPVTQEVERIMPGFKVGYVFAYEDTEGAPLPSVVDILDQQVVNADQFLAALREVSPVPITYEHLNSSANGYFSLTDRTIHVEESLPELQRIKTTIHEIGHAYLHDKDGGTDISANKREREVEAESVAYTVCSYFSLDTSDYSFGYIAGWSEGKELKELQDKLTIIKETAGVIIDKLDAEFLKIQLQEMLELTYKNGDGYFRIEKCSSGYEYDVFDRELHKVGFGVIDDPTIPIDRAAELGMEQVGFKKDFATPYNDDSLKQKIEQANTAINEKAEITPGTAIAEEHHVPMHR